MSRTASTTCQAMETSCTDCFATKNWNELLTEMITGFSVFCKLLLLTFDRHRMSSLYDACCKSPRPRMYNHWFSGSRDAQCTTRWHHCRGPHRSMPASQDMSREYFLCAACCRQVDATACSLRLRCVCLKLNSRIRFSLELETAIQLQCHIDYMNWNCPCIVLHLFVCDDLNSMQNCDIITVILDS